MAMTKVLKAKYDAAENVLRLVEPLDGVKDDETVSVTVETPANPERPWLALEGSLSIEAGESLARAHEELFPPWK
jgi:hypothetical protein